MRNHKLVHHVVDKMLLYNHALYIEDINNIIQSRQFNNNINYYLGQITSMLSGVLQTQNQYNVQNTNIVQYLKPVFSSFSTTTREWNVVINSYVVINSDDCYQ